MSGTPSLEALRKCVLDLSQPVSKRTHASFYLRTMGTHDAMLVIAEALKNREDTPLMRHELAYILGQMQDVAALPTLSAILEDDADDVLVRHESAEAIGAIGSAEYIPILTKYVNCEHPEIAETCQIAIDLIQWKSAEEERLRQEADTEKSLYLSHDPAPPIAGSNNSVGDLQKELMDTTKSLFLRYRAMFSLRNLNNDESALALTTGFSDSSALFRHEIAYVLGQMQRPVTADALSVVLSDCNEHRMVRHEAAEALGAIGGEKVEKVLATYRNDDENVVSESCEVALDNMDYWSNEFAGSAN